jgi:uncharacterized protein YdeI (YjbR/CyaY-like superfamily)
VKDAARGWHDPGHGEPEPEFFDRPEAFEAWLEVHGRTSDGIWVRMAKKGTGVPSLDWAGGVEVALCFGWIDGQSRRIDDAWFVQRFTPRRARSTWSKVNRTKVEALEAAGRMRPAGRRRSSAPRPTGAGTAPTTARPPPPCPRTSAAALADAGMTAAFAALSAQDRYGVLHRVQTAVRPETRARRIARYVEALAEGRPPLG